MGQSTKRQDGKRKQLAKTQMVGKVETDDLIKQLDKKSDGDLIYDNEESLEYFNRFIAGDR